MRLKFIGSSLWNLTAKRAAFYWLSFNAKLLLTVKSISCKCESRGAKDKDKKLLFESG